jgi:hypothetical protein
MKTTNLIAALLFAAGSAFAQVPSYVPTNGLVGWWPFNGNANDESGNGNNGTVNGATLTPDRLGVTNSSYTFNRNTNNSIDIGPAAVFDTMGEMTISVWCKLMSIGAPGESGYNHIINKCDQNPITQQGTYQFVLSNNITGFYFYYNNHPSFFQTTQLPILNSWMHILVTYNFDPNSSLNSKCKFYFNGVCTDSFPTVGQLQQTSYGIKVGTYSGESYNRVDGSLDDIAIWNRALTQQEITNLYNAQNIVACNAGFILQNDTSICSGATLQLQAQANPAQGTSCFTPALKTAGNQNFNISSVASDASGNI